MSATGNRSKQETQPSQHNERMTQQELVSSNGRTQAPVKRGSWRLGSFRRATAVIIIHRGWPAPCVTTRSRCDMVLQDWLLGSLDRAPCPREQRRIGEGSQKSAAHGCMLAGEKAGLRAQQASELVRFVLQHQAYQGAVSSAGQGERLVELTVVGDRSPWSIVLPSTRDHLNFGSSIDQNIP
jgi:hypothetical protein